MRAYAEPSDLITQQVKKSLYYLPHRRSPFDFDLRIRADNAWRRHFRSKLLPASERRGRPWKAGCKSVKQTNRIYCDGQYPSRIMLPVVKLAARR